MNTIKILEDRIAIHQEWADYFEKHYEKETHPEFKKLGNALFHRQCIKEYQFIISQFNKMVKALEEIKIEAAMFTNCNYMVRKLAIEALKALDKQS